MKNLIAVLLMLPNLAHADFAQDYANETAKLTTQIIDLALTKVKKSGDWKAYSYIEPIHRKIHAGVKIKFIDGYDEFDNGFCAGGFIGYTYIRPEANFDGKSIYLCKFNAFDPLYSAQSAIHEIAHLVFHNAVFRDSSSKNRMRMECQAYDIERAVMVAADLTPFQQAPYRSCGYSKHMIRSIHANGPAIPLNELNF